MYEFFCASLPELRPGTLSPLTVDQFDEAAASELSARRLAQLQNRDPDAETAEKMPRVYSRYRTFDNYLRDRIARRRADRAGISVNLPDPDEYFQMTDFRLGAVFAAEDPLEREDLIDRIRWDYLDELEEGHFFDFDFLCVYRLRLELLAKLRNRSVEVGRRNFDAAVEEIV